MTRRWFGGGQAPPAPAPLDVQVSFDLNLNLEKRQLCEKGRHNLVVEVLYSKGVFCGAPWKGVVRSVASLQDAKNAQILPFKDRFLNTPVSKQLLIPGSIMLENLYVSQI